MMDAFHEGGWGMYPTLVSGLLLLGAAIRFATGPNPRWIHLPVLAGLTFVTGVLGFVTGLIRTLQFAAGRQDQAALVAQGTAESLHNVALALIFVVCAGITLVIALYRKPASHRDLTAV
jgi:hypothetical protein